MAYNTDAFEKAANSRGYVIESIRKSFPDAVESAKGSIVEGTLVKQVRWDAEGKCFSYRCKPLPKYDLPLNKNTEDMDEERFEQLYNRILDGENWDYSTLDELISLSESDAREEGRKEMKVKAIKARIATCPYLSDDKQGICVNGIHCDESCDEIKKFIAQL